MSITFIARPRKMYISYCIKYEYDWCVDGEVSDAALRPEICIYHTFGDVSLRIYVFLSFVCFHK